MFVACFGISDAATMDPVTTLKRKNQDSVPWEWCIFCKDVKKHCSAANDGLRSTVTSISRIKDVIVDCRQYGNRSEVLDMLSKVTDSDWETEKVV